MSTSSNVLSLPIVSESSTLPLALDVLARYWGEDFADSHQTLAAQSNDLISGIEILESRGLLVYTYQSSIKDLKKKIDQKMPLISIVPGLRDVIQHATIVSGYEHSERRIMTYVPEPDTYGAIPESKFDMEWKQDNHCAILVVPSEMRKIVEKDEMKFQASNRLYLECERLWRSAKAMEAKSKLSATIQREPDNPQIWCLLGSVHNDLCSPEAVACYQRAIELNCEYFLAFRGMGNYFLKRKEYQEAKRWYTKAIQIHPLRFAPIYKNRGICSIEIGDKEDAKKDFLSYLQQMPNAPDGLHIQSAIKEL